VTAVASLSGHRLVSCTSDGCVALWDASRGGDAVAKLQICPQGDAIAVLADGRRVAIGTTKYNTGTDRAVGGGIVMWDTNTASGATPASIDWGVGVCQLAVLHNGHLVAGCQDGTLRVVDADAGAVVATLEGHANAAAAYRFDSGVRALAVLLDGRVASTTRGPMVWVWDVGKRACGDTLMGHTSSVAALAVLPDGLLASGSSDNTVRLWDTRGSRSTCIISLFAGYSVSALTVLPGGRLASASWASKLMVWDTRNASSVLRPPVALTLQCVCTSVLVPLPGGRLATGGTIGSVRLWQLPPDVVPVPL